MTSDRPLDPFLRQLEDFSDQVFRGQSTPANDLDSATRGAVHRLRAIDRIPPLDQTRMQSRKDELMSFTTSWPLATESLAPAIQGANGAHPLPIPMPHRPTIRPKRSRLLPLISAAVLIALIGGLIFGIVENRNDGNPTVPAVIQGSPSPEASPLGSDWGQFRGGLSRTGYTADPGPGGDLNLQWSFTADESLNGIMEADGKVFAYGAEGGLYAIDALTGQQVWAIDLIEGQFGDVGQVPLPAVANGVVYASTPAGVLVAVDAETGSVLWQKPITNEALSAPTITDGHIYVAVDGATIRSLDAANGEEQWSWEAPGGISTQYPTIADGKLFVADDATMVYAVDLQTGATLWATQPLQAHRVSAYLDGRLYAPGTDGSLTALDASTGAVLWSSEPHGAQALNPIATEQGIIVAIEADTVESLDPATGAVLWTMSAGDVANSPHAGGSTLYLEIEPGVFAAIELAIGAEMGRTAEAVGAGSTVAVSGEMLFVSGRDGPVRAFGPGGGSPVAVSASSPALVELATPQPAQEEAAVALPTVNAGEMEAELISSQAYPADREIAGFQRGPSGTIWIAFLDGEMRTIDRDGNLVGSHIYPTGNSPGEFDWEVRIPSPLDIWWFGASIAWSDDGTMYVTDTDNARVQVLDSEGTLIGTWGSRGDEDGQFKAPVWIARSPDGEFAVVDLGRQDIQWFDRDGNFLRKLTGTGEGESFGRPTSIAYDQNGDFWVLDTSYQRLDKFDAEGHHLLAIGGTQSSAPGQFYEPATVDVDGMGRVWVTDQTNQRVQVFDADGNLLDILDTCGTEAGCFLRPGWIIAGGNDYVYVLDVDLNFIQDRRLMKFHITSMPEVPMMAAATPAAAGLATPVASPVAG
jgi:outer membrane protein assembly factor BamB